MGSLNKVMLIGNLGKDPELRTTASGASVANMSIATKEFTTKNGKAESKSEWHNIVLWGKLADNAANFLQKGSSVFIEGRLQTTSYRNKDGNTVYKTEIVASNMQFLTKTNNSNTQQGQGSSASEKDPIIDDDLPF